MPQEKENENMNILFLIGHIGHGGAENVVATLTSQLAQKGHRITLVTHLKNQFYTVAPEVNLIDVRKWEYDTFEGKLPVRIFKKIANRFKDYSNIKRIIREEKPDVTISFLAAWLWQLIFLCKDTPLICAERNAMEYPHGRNNFLTKRILYKRAYAVQVMSRYDKAWLRNRYRRVFPMPNPLRFEPLTLEKYDSIFANRKNILACGRIHPQKGFEKLISAFSKIADKYPEWNVDIVGLKESDDYFNSLVKMINGFGLEDRIHFLGPRNDMDAIMQSHSVFCLSSQHEGFPNVLSEAMANGMASVSFDIVTGPSEIIIDGLDGVIVEDQNEDELAEGLSSIMADKGLRYLLGANAIKNIKRFERDKIVDRWEQFFLRISNEYKYSK